MAQLKPTDTMAALRFGGASIFFPKRSKYLLHVR
jgi:hypothetical protein